MKDAYLKKIIPAENKFRFYAVCITPTLFGSWSLIRQWGRIGSTGSKMEEWFDSEKFASEAGEKILNQKIRKGYS